MSPSAHHHSIRVIVALICAVSVAGCSSELVETTPQTIEAATGAVSPSTTVAPAGRVLPLPGRPTAARYDAATGSLAVLNGPALAILQADRTLRTVTLPSPATALTGDGNGTVWAATRGGVITIDLAAGTATPTAIEDGTDFTAIARRADGRLVLGTADGAVYLLDAAMKVSHRDRDFARVDAIVTQGDTPVVLDRGQTSVTALGADGQPQQALRAGLGATSIAADATGRVLVTDSRGGQLLVFTVDPLIERQAYPVADSPFGLTGSPTLVWVSQTASNSVVGYDLGTGIPVEKVRYPTVQQPD